MMETSLELNVWHPEKTYYHPPQILNNIYTTFYVMELKLDKTTDSAMQKIDLKNYLERFALSELLAVNVDGERRTLGDWMKKKEERD